MDRTVYTVSFDCAQQQKDAKDSSYIYKCIQEPVYRRRYCD